VIPEAENGGGKNGENGQPDLPLQLPVSGVWQGCGPWWHRASTCESVGVLFASMPPCVIQC
jgi:hypothetical protein